MTKFFMIKYRYNNESRITCTIFSGDTADAVIKEFKRRNPTYTIIDIIEV